MYDRRKVEEILDSIPGITELSKLCIISLPEELQEEAAYRFKRYTAEKQDKKLQ